MDRLLGTDGIRFEGFLTLVLYRIGVHYSGHGIGLK